MRTVTLGQAAEAAVAAYLQEQGYDITDRNWKTRWCEIDLIAQKREVIYFVEVKYRSKASQGSGFDHITSKKLKQMEFAASAWVNFHNWPGDYQLVAAEVSGANFNKIKIIEI